MDQKSQDLEGINNSICRRCHRRLRDIESIKLGFGKVCYEKYNQSKKNYLFEIERGEN